MTPGRYPAGDKGPTREVKVKAMRVPSREEMEAKPRLLLAFDKFRGTISARDLSRELATPFAGDGLDVDTQALSDGGEGFLDAFDGETISVVVPGPLGADVHSRMVFRSSPRGPIAVTSVAEVVGYQQLASATPRQALEARSDGVGHLVLEAARRGAVSVLVGCGGSVTSDGGRGCYDVLERAGGLPVPVDVATDVTSTFLGARRFAPQKGVAESDLGLIDQRLSELRERYRSEQGRDVELLPRAGAGGGIAGGLAALGATLVDGFDVYAHALDLPERIRRASIVVTGEGRFDFGSLEGKTTMKIARLVADGCRFLVICGQVEPEAARTFQTLFTHSTLVSLEERYGWASARQDVVANIRDSIRDFVSLGGV